MADNILKNEFMWEKKQEKKKLYKNWKLYAIALGITVIGAGTGLGVYYGVFANHSDVVKIDLSTIEFETTISGTENMKIEDAFNEFISNNNTITDLETNVEAGTFTQPTYTTSGSLVINATTTGKYTGTITVTINAIGQTNLNDLTDLNTTLTEAITDKQTAFQSFLDLNQEKYPDLKGNVEAGTFKEPSYTTAGSLEINATATGKYTGTITVTINAIGQTNLSTLNLNKKISGKENMTEEDTFNAFLNLNQEKYPDLKDNVEAGTFKAPTYTESGSLKINATKDGKYNGTITVTINAIGQTDLSTIKFETTILGTENMKAEEAFQLFLNANKDILDLENNIQVGTFRAPSYTESGSLKINATSNSKYTGTITVTINAIERTKLSDLNLNTTITGIQNMTKEYALNTFLKNNSNTTDLKDNVEAGTFTAPNYTESGSLKINATTTGKYTGTIIITISSTKPLFDEYLQKISDAAKNNDEVLWSNLWFYYFNLIINNIDSINYVLTKEELADNTKAQVSFLNQLKAFIETQLKEWNITQGYYGNSLTTKYDSFNIANETITANGELTINLKYISAGITFNIYKQLSYSIHYTTID